MSPLKKPPLKSRLKLLAQIIFIKSAYLRKHKTNTHFRIPDLTLCRTMLKSAGTITTEEVGACADRARGCLETLSARSIYYSGFRHYNNVWFWVLPSYFPIVLPCLLSNIKGLKHFLMVLSSKAIHYNTPSVLLSWSRMVHAIT